MNNWLDFSKQRQIDLFNQISSRTGIYPQAIEKDAWVTLVLAMIFNAEIKDYLVFKGGTSLSKVYHLINRFSEDIDLAIDRRYLGFSGDLTKGEIRKLRRKAHDFVSINIRDLLEKQFNNNGIDPSLYQIIVENTLVSDKDPEIIQVNYKSVFEEVPYLLQKVIIEIGARSLLHPFERKKISSIINDHYPKSGFSTDDVFINTMIPEKTFLEKLLLLHEEFQKPREKLRHKRMSRHLFDIYQIINTEYGRKALIDTNLFNSIIKHREKYTPVKLVDYSSLKINRLKFIPPDDFFELYKNDYKEMQENMIYGESPEFEKIINGINRKFTSIS